MPIDHVNALPPGTRFEEYRLDTVLGAGGFGITYRAYDANLDKFVAIKEYLPVEFATRTEASTVVPHSNADAQDYHWGLSRFLDEARTLARFDHPNLNKVYRFFEANGTAYMVLEYIEGETLSDRLSREPRLEEAALQRLLEEVLSGLAVMHEAGYVHRDIKPGNLMLRAEDGSAVLLDFGAARQAVGQRSKPITSILTPGYAPVEQYDGKVDRVGPWTDLYALGMVAYRCISGLGDGELPDAVARMLAQSKGDAGLLPAAEAGKGRYDAKLLEAIDWAMELDEESRPQGVGAWRRALAGGGRRESPAGPARTEAVRHAGKATPERRRMSWSSVALVMVIVALLGASAWQGWRLYREMPDVDSDAALTTAEPQVGGPAELRTGAEPDEQAGDTPAGTQPDSAAETAAPMLGASGDAAVAGGAGAADPTQPSTQPDTSPPPEQDAVAWLLAGAKADIEAQRLTSPVGNNAWEKYQRVLGLSPAHPEAIAGMERVIGNYLELFGAALEQQEFDEAESYLTRIRELHPDSPALREGRQRLQAAKQAQAEREAAEAARLAEQEQQRQAEEAARLAEQERQRQAEEAAREERLAEQERQRQAELERQRAEQAIKAHWSAFEAALRSHDMGEAERRLAQVRSLDPEGSGLAVGERRLAQARVFGPNAAWPLSSEAADKGQDFFYELCPLDTVRENLDFEDIIDQQKDINQSPRCYTLEQAKISIICRLEDAYGHPDISIKPWMRRVPNWKQDAEYWTDQQWRQFGCEEGMPFCYPCDGR